jgi:hypothetical protein
MNFYCVKCGHYIPETLPNNEKPCQCSDRKQRFLKKFKGSVFENLIERLFQK